MTRAVVGVGASGARAERLVEAALAAIAAHPALTLIAQSGGYENPAVGSPQPHRFVNAACLVETPLAPEALLRALFALERRAGRLRAVRFGARSLDLDLLWTDGARRDAPPLSVPHPRLLERAFALVPLLEVFRRADRPLPLPLVRAAAATACGARLRRLPPAPGPAPALPS